jgi:protein SCO1/2
MMTPTRSLVAVTLALAGLALAPGRPSAHSPELHAPAPASPAETTIRPVTVKLPDVELLDQDGRRVRFKSDVVGNRLVVIDLIYTTCPVVCPILSATFASLQDMLGDRLGRDVLLVSISVDPLTDIPTRLKAYANKWGAKPGWVFLTGEKRKVDTVLRGLNAYAADFTNHPSTILVGDGLRDDWTRFYGFPTPERVHAALNEVAARRQAKR